MKIYLIQDDAGKICKESVSIDKETCLINFVKERINRADTPSYYEAKSVFKLFERKGWELVEFDGTAHSEEKLYNPTKEFIDCVCESAVPYFDEMEDYEQEENRRRAKKWIEAIYKNIN